MSKSKQKNINWQKQKTNNLQKKCDKKNEKV